MATLDKRGARSWRARVRVPGFGIKSRTFDTKAEAQVWADRIEGRLRAGIDTVPNISIEPTLGEALDRYEKEITPHKKGHEQERRRIAAWRKHPMATTKLSRLTVQHFVQFRDERIKTGRAGNTVRLDLALISNLYNIARIEWGMPYLANPIANLRQPKMGRGRDRRLSAAEAERFRQAIQGGYNKLIPALVEFAVETAARQGELLRLEWGDIDQDRRMMILRDTKNGEDRRVPLSQGAMAVLGQFDRQSGERVFPTTRDAIAAAWKRILARAKIADYRFHDLRHEATTRLFERGLEVMEVQRITGHKTLSMLMRYTQMDVSRIVRRLDATEGQAPPASSAPHSPLPANVVRFPSRR
jgi:integrase